MPWSRAHRAETLLSSEGTQYSITDYSENGQSFPHAAPKVHAETQQFLWNQGKGCVKIDAALKAMKISGNTTVISEAQNESRRFFEYEIDF